MSYWEKIKSELEVRYKDKAILLLGFGKEGMSTYTLLKQLNTNLHLSIMDQNPIAVKNFLKEKEDLTTGVIGNDGYLEGLDFYEVIFKTPGLPGHLLQHLDPAKITGQSQLFMEFLGERTIGITGTKGKSTTSSLLTHVLAKGGLTVRLVGNIGFPALESLVDDDGERFYVYELSSFQTEFLQVGPQIRVILNLFEEHLNNYISYNAYQESKMQLFKARALNHVEPLCIYGCDNKLLMYKIKQLKDHLKVSREESKEVSGRRFKTFGRLSNNLLGDSGYFIENEGIVSVNAKKIETTSNIHFSRKLLGEHNLINSLVAMIVVDELNQLGVTHMQYNELILHIGSFEGLKHRLENMGVYREITFYDDSISTIPEAAMKAAEAIENLSTLIIGGYDREIDYTQFAHQLKNLKEIAIVCLPTTGHKVADLMGNPANTYKVDDMEEAIVLCYQLTPKGKACLLSPAASSYNRYKNFEERGDHFRECVVRGENVSND